MIAARESLRVLLYEGLGSRELEGGERAEILQGLLEKGYAVTRVRPGGRVSEAGLEGHLVVLGRWEGETPPESGDAVTLRFHDVEGMAAGEVVGLVERLRDEAELPAPGGWKPWFPVIDYSRCTNCMQCLSFCLFDVYGVSSEGKIQVQNQDKCKTDCPACSRVCPEVAILFPKYRSGPINGDEIQAEDLRREAMKVDISALLGGDIYATLRERSAKAKSRFAKERDEGRALQERVRCLNKLQKEMGVDIPPEVLASLPSTEEIQTRAEEAKARAQAALARSPSAEGSE